MDRLSQREVGKIARSRTEELTDTLEDPGVTTPAMLWLNVCGGDGLQGYSTTLLTGKVPTGGCGFGHETTSSIAQSLRGEPNV